MMIGSHCQIMSRTAVVLVVLLVMAPLSGGTVAGADVTLTVTVTDPSGDRVAGADLTATWDGGSASEETAANGQALIDVPEGADVEIEVEHPEYVRNHPVVVENASEQDVTVDMFARGTATISVADPDGSVADARVVLRKDGRIVTDGRTSAEGTYQTDVIEQGDYTVSVVKRGYYRERSSLTVDGDVDQNVTIERGSVTLQIRVTDPHFDPPQAVGNLTVSIQSVGQFTTQPGGTASVGVPVNADLPMTVTGDEYEEVSRTINVREDDVAVNVSISRIPQLHLEAVSNRVVVGERVVLQATNEYDEPVAGATVRLDDEAVGETDANGQLAVTVSEPGNHTLVAEDGELRSGTVTVAGVDENGEIPTATATATEETDESTASTPGFTSLTAVLALLAVALIARRRD